MYHIAVRHKVRVVLLLVLLAAAIVTIAPWIYENLFVRDEGFTAQGESFFDLDPAAFLKDSGISEHVSLDAVLLNNGYVFSELYLRNLDIRRAAVSARIITKGRIVKDDEGRAVGFSGKLLSKNITLNSGPFLPVRASFRISRDKLYVETLRLGRPYKLKGNIGLTEPFEIDLRLEVDRADMRSISSISKLKGRNAAFGIVSGSFDIKGTLAGSIFSEGIIESRNGRIGSIGYNLVTLKLEGFGPIINITDSSIKQDSGTLTIEGYVDLRKIAGGNLFDGVRIKSDMKTIAWNDWDIKKKGADELSMEKDISDNMRVGFKTMTREPLTTYYDRENPEEMSLEYKMGMENLKLKLKDKEEFFGIEHSVRF